MGKQTRKILFAAILSLCSYGVTYYIYQSKNKTNSDNENTKPVAFAHYVEEDVQRRPAARLIWQSLNTGEPLYPGESIKTSAKGQVRIQFAQNDRYIDLDPDSLIVISQNNNEISLDLMDGSLFVAGGTGDSSTALTLNSTKGKVDLSKATASLSKSNSGKIDLQVIKGSAKTEDGKDLSDFTSKVKLLSPAMGTPSVINPENVEPIQFAWTGFPQESQVSIWAGSSRKELKPVPSTSVKDNSLNRKFPVGKHFFKLVATDKKTSQVIGESEVYRLEVIAKYPPGVISPTGDSFLVMDKKVNPVTFKWNKPDGAENVYFELARDLDFKDKITSKNFIEEDTYTHQLSGGSYYYRLSSKYENSDKSFSTKPIHFTVSAKPKVDVVIHWLNKDKKSYFFIDKAKVQLAWDSPQKSDVKKWKLNLWPASEGRSLASAQEPKAIETAKSVGEVELTQAGTYHAVVQAYNEHSTLLSESEEITFDVLPKPLLKAPLLYPETGDLKADQKGNIQLQWTKHDEAKEYTLILMDKDGKELKKGRFGKNSTSLVNLMPGQYQVRVIATDTHGRESEKGPNRNITVPDTSGLKAPKLKKVKVN